MHVKSIFISRALEISITVNKLYFELFFILSASILVASFNSYVYFGLCLQGGTVTAMTIDKGILMGFVPSGDTQVRRYSFSRLTSMIR